MVLPIFSENLWKISMKQQSTFESENLDTTEAKAESLQYADLTATEQK